MKLKAEMNVKDITQYSKKMHSVAFNSTLHGTLKQASGLTEATRSTLLTFSAMLQLMGTDKRKSQNVQK
jgi:hypothetical protein